MNSIASCFNAGSALLRENVRRFWPIPVIGFLIYFLSGVFPILMNYRNLDRLAYYIEMTLKNQNPFYLAAHLFLPIVSAVLVFRYLHSSASASVVHSMPFTRTCLFGSGFLSSLFLFLSPLFLNGLILLCIAKPVYTKEYVYNETTMTSVETLVNVFTRQAIGIWLLDSFVILLFVFSVAVFAGMITGNSLMHFLTALGFQFMCPALFITFLGYCEIYLFGFTPSGNVREFFLKLSPLIRPLLSSDDFAAPGLWLGYLAAAAALTVAGLFLYRRRKLERAGDAFVFPLIQPVICCLITFFSMSLFGFYFSMMDNRRIYLYGGYAAGTLVGFLLAQMIVRKTVRIFDTASLRRFGLYCLLALLFFGGLLSDISGYERRVPEVDSIVAVTVNQTFLSDSYYRYENQSSVEKQTFQDPSNVAVVQNLHRRLLEDRNLYEDFLKDSELYIHWDTISISYTRKDGSQLSRVYRAPNSLLRSYDFLAELYESDEYRRAPLMASLPEESFNYLNITSDFQKNRGTGSPLGASFNAKERISSLAAALCQDLRSQSYADLCRASVPMCTIEIGYRSSGSTNVENFQIYPEYRQTTAWLKENGLSEYARYVGDETSEYFMAIEPYVLNGEMPYWSGDLPDSDSSWHIPASDASTLIVADSEKINEILFLCEDNYPDDLDMQLGGSAYAITLISPVSMENYEYYGYDSSFIRQSYCLSPDRAPDWIKEYFL